jgi:hypothetical protein
MGKKDQDLKLAEDAIGNYEAEANKVCGTFIIL